MKKVKKTGYILLKLPEKLKRKLELKKWKMKKKGVVTWEAFFLKLAEIR